MRLPLQIVQVGSERVNRLEQTRDISSGGVSFLCEGQVLVGGRIEYIVTLSESNPPVRIRCLGKVVRAAQQEAAAPFEVAVTMERYQFLRTKEPGAMAARA